MKIINAAEFQKAWKLERIRGGDRITDSSKVDYIKRKIGPNVFRLQDGQVIMGSTMNYLIIVHTTPH